MAEPNIREPMAYMLGRDLDRPGGEDLADLESAQAMDEQDGGWGWPDNDEVRTTSDALFGCWR